MTAVYSVPVVDAKLRKSRCCQGRAISLLSSVSLPPLVLILNIYVCYVCICWCKLCVLYVAISSDGYKRALDTLELDLQAVVSQHVGAEN